MDMLINAPNFRTKLHRKTTPKFADIEWLVLYKTKFSKMAYGNCGTTTKLFTGNISYPQRINNKNNI